MKWLIITVTILALLLGIFLGVNKEPEKVSVGATVKERSSKPNKPVVVAPQAITASLSARGLQHDNAPNIIAMLTSEEPPTIQITATTSIQDIANEYIQFLDVEDIGVLNGDANAIIIEKATPGMAKEKDKTNFTNP